MTADFREIYLCWTILYIRSPRRLHVIVFEDYRNHTMVFVIHVAYGVVAKVSHDQMILFVVHVDYVIVPGVYHDQTMIFIVHVDCSVTLFVVHVDHEVYSDEMIVFIVHVMDCGVFSEVYITFAKRYYASSTWTKSFSARILMTTMMFFVFPRGLRRHLRGQSRPDDIIRSPRELPACFPRFNIAQTLPLIKL